MIKILLTFDMLVTLMKKRSAVVICRDGGKESIELRLEQDEYPEDLDEALGFVQNEWENM